MPDVMSDGASPEALLEARGIVRSFGEVRALGGVDLTLNAGKVHALLGVNGAGKTTLMRILCGLDAPSSGSVRATSSAPLPKIVGYCPQELTIWGDLTALEQVVMLGMLHCQPGERAREKKKKVHERALTLLDALGLTSRTGDLAAAARGAQVIVNAWNRTFRPALQAAMPSAVARWVLPVPLAPTSRMFSR